MTKTKSKKTVRRKSACTRVGLEPTSHAVGARMAVSQIVGGNGDGDGDGNGNGNGNGDDDGDGGGVGVGDGVSDDDGVGDGVGDGVDEGMGGEDEESENGSAPRRGLASSGTLAAQ